MAKVTLVIPTYNEEKFIAPLIASVKDQSLLPDEVLVIDASSDSTPDICSKAGFKVLKQTSKGISGARKEAFDAAAEEVIASTDADSVLTKKWIEVTAELFNDPKVVAVYGPVYFMDGPLWLRLLSRFGFTFFLKLNHISGKPHLSGMNFAVRQSAYKAIGGYRTELVTAEDVDLGLRIRSQGKILYDSRLVVFTSARRVMGMGVAKFFWHHLKNYLNMYFRGHSSADFKPFR
jgi:glycosyltransferase involved in cell wall biosynthesis